MTFIDLLSDRLKIPYEDIKNLLMSAPYRYKEYSIPKRNGRGTRLIAQPSKEVKLLQRWVTTQLEDVLPVHSSATGYIKGKNILTNARAHVDSNYLLKMDFRNFFPSINKETLLSHFRVHVNALDQICVSDQKELDYLVRLFLRWSKSKKRLEMAIGAPSSPFLSNTVMFDLDVSINEYCSANGIIYTRYADDLAFSATSPRQLRKAERAIRSIVHNVDYPKLRFNTEKTVHASRAVRRTVTGLILTPDGAVSVGRDRKRMIRSALHHATTRNLSENEIAELNGYLAYVHSIEPEFYDKMMAKYGDIIPWLSKI